MTILVLSGHYFGSKRQAGFHWLSKAFAGLGHEVRFVTVGVSWLSRLRGQDHRLAYPLEAESKGWKEEGPGLFSTVWWGWWHPVHLRRPWLNALTKPWFRAYGHQLPRQVVELLPQVDVVMVESAHGLMAMGELKRRAPQAKFIYRVSDDLEVLLTHPVVLEAEAKHLDDFDLISVPSAYFLERFRHHPKLQVANHGVQKEAFAELQPNPFPGPGPHAVLVGNSHIDLEFFDLSCRALPQWTFHVIGPIQGLPQHPNLIAYGEMPFAKTIPYLQWADLGLQCRSHDKGCESLTDSLKVIQYTLCRKAVVAPSFLASPRKNLYTYEPGKASSMVQALEAAAAHVFQDSDAPLPQSWEELAAQLLHEVA